MYIWLILIITEAFECLSYWTVSHFVSAFYTRSFSWLFCTNIVEFTYLLVLSDIYYIKLREGWDTLDILCLPSVCFLIGELNTQLLHTACKKCDRSLQNGLSDCSRKGNDLFYLRSKPTALLRWYLNWVWDGKWNLDKWRKWRGYLSAETRTWKMVYF